MLCGPCVSPSAVSCTRLCPRTVPPFSCLELFRDSVSQVSAASSVQSNKCIVHHISNLFITRDVYVQMPSVYAQICVLYKRRMLSAPCLRPAAAALPAQLPSHPPKSHSSGGWPAAPFHGELQLTAAGSFLSDPRPVPAVRAVGSVLTCCVLLCTVSCTSLSTWLFTGTLRGVEKVGLFNGCSP